MPPRQTAAPAQPLPSGRGGPADAGAGWKGAGGKKPPPPAAQLQRAGRLGRAEHDRHARSGKLKWTRRPSFALVRSLVFFTLSKTRTWCIVLARAERPASLYPSHSMRSVISRHGHLAGQLS